MIWNSVLQIKKGKNEAQVINHNKDNTNTNKNNGKSKISVVANCINNNFQSINSSTIKGTVNMERNN